MKLKEPISILIIDDNSSFVLSLLRSFSGYPNVQLYVLLSSVKKPFYFRHSRYLKKIYREQLTEENFGKTVKEVVIKSSADLIIPTREWISKLLYKNKQSLENEVKIQPVSDVTTIETVNDKRKLNRWLENNSFPCSLAVPVNKDTEAAKITDLFSFPLLLKPAMGLGGEGIKLVSTPDNLKAILSSDEIFKKEYFLQEYIPGYDIGINIFSIDGKILCHTIQKALFSGKLTYSRGTEFVKNPELFNLTSSIVSKLGYTGVANLDFRYDIKKRQFVLLDFNARYWSTLEGSGFMGVNFPMLVAAHSLGIGCSCPDYSTGTYYCTWAAIKTFAGNLFSGKKYPIKLSHTKLHVILLDPVPEIIRAGEITVSYLRRIIRNIKLDSLNFLKSVFVRNKNRRIV